MQQNDRLIGHNLDGYLIEELLGHGGMGRVYRALDVNLNRYAAIKILDVQARKPKQYEKRFYREAQAIAKLKHQNIVAVYRFNDVDDVFYMAMEYIDGADLRWLMRDYSTDNELMDYETMLSIIEQTAKALDFAHQNGVIHRDIKPPNIMISRNGNAILTDFGLALDTDQGSIGEIFGSPHYIAPEQAINSADAVPQTDIYSLGVILYEMLSGSIPFIDGSIIEIAMSHIHETPPNPRSFNPDLHPSFLPILEKALAKDVKDRYQTGAALVADLKAAVRNIEKTHPARVFSTLSKPAERIALNISPLPLPEIFEDTKPPTLIRDSAATFDFADDESAIPTKKEVTPIKKEKPRRRSPLTGIALVLLIIGLGVAGLYFLAPETLTSFLPSSIIANSPQGNNAMIEGPIQRIDTATTTLIIYDLAIQIDHNHELWDAAEVNGIVHIEGHAIETDTGLRFDRIELAIYDGEIIGEEE